MQGCLANILLGRPWILSTVEQSPANHIYWFSTHKTWKFPSRTIENLVIIQRFSIYKYTSRQKEQRKVKADSSESYRTLKTFLAAKQQLPKTSKASDFTNLLAREDLKYQSNENLQLNQITKAPPTSHTHTTTKFKQKIVHRDVN